MADILTDIESFFGIGPPVGPGDSVSDAAVRAVGIDPATNTWIDPQDHPGEDAAQVAAQARADASAFFGAHNPKNGAPGNTIDAQHEAAGGFLEDLFHPLSANVDPSKSTTNKLKDAAQSIPWKTILVVGVLILLVAGVHEVREL